MKVFVSEMQLFFVLYVNSSVTPLLLICLLYYFSFSFLPDKDSWFTTVLDGNIRGFVNFPLLVFELTVDELVVIRKKYTYYRFDEKTSI